MTASLQMTLQRINAIERQFASLTMQTPIQKAEERQKTEKEFKEILDTKVNNKKGQPVPNEKIESLIEEYSAKNNLDKDFVKSVVRHESGFNVNATSKCGVPSSELFRISR